MTLLSVNPTRPVTALLTLSLALASPTWATGSTKEILQRFVEDYRSDPMLVDATFGIEVGDERFHVTARRTESEPYEVELHEGFPESGSWYFTLDDKSVLDMIDQRKINAGTAMMKAFSTDETPMDVETSEGFQPADGFLGTMLKVTFHFWNRGFPEIIPFGDEYTRFTHGSDGIIFYYQPGFRSGWFSIKKGHHVNADPRSRTNPFPSMMVFTEGEGRARIGGRDINVSKGEALFVPPGVSHEFFNENDAPLQGVLLMFGEGA